MNWQSKWTLIMTIMSLLIDNTKATCTWSSWGSWNDTAYCSETTRVDSIFDNIPPHIRYAQVSYLDQFEFNLNPNSSLKIVEFKNSKEAYISCPNENSSAKKIAQNSPFQNGEFQRCMEVQCRALQSKVKCTNNVVSFELQDPSKLTCLSQIKQIQLENYQTKFHLMASNFFSVADSLEEIELDHQEITFPDKFDDLFVNLPKLRVLKMKNFVYTALASIITANRNLVMIDSKNFRAWNLCSQIELIDKTGKRTYIDLKQDSLSDKNTEELLKISIEVTKKVINENLEHSKSVFGKLTKFFNTLPSTEQNVLIFLAVFAVVILMYLVKCCAS